MSNNNLTWISSLAGKIQEEPPLAFIRILSRQSNFLRLHNCTESGDWVLDSTNPSAPLQIRLKAGKTMALSIQIKRSRLTSLGNTNLVKKFTKLLQLHATPIKARHPSFSRTRLSAGI